MQYVGYLVLGLIAALVWVLIRAIRFPKQYEKLVVLRLGKFAGVRGPGFTLVLPFMETAVQVDMREKFLDIPAQTAITRDNASILIDFLVYYRITEPDLAVLKVENVESASANIATTTLRAVIGDIELDGVLSKREEINDTLRLKLDEATERWGLKVTAVEIREIEPPREILDAMNRQMSAERERRAEVTRAQGEREADITRAEGQKQSEILKAEGQRQSAILEAEGQQQSQRLKAEGYAEALKVIYEAAHTLDDKTMALQYMQMLQQIGSSASTKFVLPMELMGIVQNLSKTAGLNGASKESERHLTSGD